MTLVSFKTIHWTVLTASAPWPASSVGIPVADPISRTSVRRGPEPDHSYDCAKQVGGSWYGSGLYDCGESLRRSCRAQSDPQSIYSIATTPGLNPLFHALTISIANVAPYLTGLGVQASTRLLQLFKAFAAPNFLLADEGHPRLVYYLSASPNRRKLRLTVRLETFNSVLYHRLAGGLVTSLPAELS